LTSREDVAFAAKNRREPVTILDVRCCHDYDDEESEDVHEHMSLAPFHLLPCVETSLASYFCRFDALAINNPK